LSGRALDYLKALGYEEGETDREIGRFVWHHALAITYAPEYLSENADAIQHDWPRVPLPRTSVRLSESALLGQGIARILDTEDSIPTITVGAIRPELKLIAAIRKAGSGSLSERDLQIAARWGHAGKAGATMPGPGRIVERAYTPDERAAIAAGAEALGMDETTALDCLGAETCDVYLNDTAYWANVPIRVWRYTIGGYQVIKKWLSYREYALLGRALEAEEARYVQEMARRIAAILLLGPALDANYRAVVADTYAWPRQ
jgi:hypothetical protein